MSRLRLVFLLLLVSKRDLMGRHTNSRRYNIVAWSLTGIIVVLTAVMLAAQLRA